MAAALRDQLREPSARVPTAVEAPRPTFPGGRDAHSNILPESYVGPDSCKRCHRKNYASWLEHPHRRMNQLASAESVLGDFDGRVVTLGEGVARFEHRPGGDFTLSLERTGTPRRAYRVTRTIGSRLKQFYVGVLTEGAPVRRNAPTEEVVLPFGWWIAQRRWMPISYFDPYGEDTDASGAPTFDPWKPKDIAIARVCAYCHNTVPYIYRFGDSPAALGFRDRDLVTDDPPLRAELGKLVDLGGQTRLPLEVRAHLPLDSALVSVGISCESCHFGAREHAERDAEYRFGPESPHLLARPADPHESAERTKDNPWLVKSLCRQCHSSDGKGYPDGTSFINSREAFELDASACASKIACTDCHDPHVAGPKQEGGPDSPAQVAACASCHESYAEPRAARAHARHAPRDASCLDCHMPRLTMGITGAVRTHRIGSPGDPSMLAAGAPNACNLCHLDRSLTWTLQELARGWDVRLAPQATWAAAWGGDLDRPARDVWAESPTQPVRIALIDALARHRDEGTLPRLLGHLEDRAGMTRALAALALERVLGRALAPDELDVTAPPELRSRQVEALRVALVAPSATASRPSP